MKVKSYGISDVGLVRLTNEDVFAQLTKELCFLLADGMGGHKAGEIAANETIVQLCNLIKKNDSQLTTVEEWCQFFETSIQEVNQTIHRLGQEDEKKSGMGTTLCIAKVVGPTLITAHVGDSRIYRMRKGRLTQLTQDHSLKDELIASGELDESLAISFPYKNVITRAIGTQKEVTPEIHTYETESDDFYFLCSDGLTDTLLDPQILDLIDAAPSLQEACESLVLEAKKAGGNDNITIVLFQIKL